jgi:NADH dehydrogenase
LKSFKLFSVWLRRAGLSFKLSGDKFFCMAEKVLVAGGGFAGLNCALELDSEKFDVTLVDEDGTHVFRPGLIELIRERFDVEGVTLDLEDFLEDTGIDFLEAEIQEFSPDVKAVETSEGSLDYDYLVVALGSEKRKTDFSLQYAEDFYSLDAAEQAVERFEDDEKIAVIGSGYTGVEVASELNAAGKEVQVIDDSTRPMASAPGKASHTVLDYFNEAGVKFMGGKEVEIVTNYGVELADGTEVNADRVVWCGGLEPADESRKSLDGSSEGVDVNDGLSATGYEDVFVAGDSADSGFMKTAQNAEKQGIHVAKNINSGGAILEEFDPGTSPVVVSMGDTGMLVWNGRVVKNRFFRFLKGMILRFYFLNLWRRKFSFRDSVKSSFSVLNIMGK